MKTTILATSLLLLAAFASPAQAQSPCPPIPNPFAEGSFTHATVAFGQAAADAACGLIDPAVVEAAIAAVNDAMIALDGIIDTYVAATEAAVIQAVAAVNAALLYAASLAEWMITCECGPVGAVNAIVAAFDAWLATTLDLVAGLVGEALDFVDFVVSQVMPLVQLIAGFVHETCVRFADIALVCDLFVI